MRNIQVLPMEVANRIAAGEVVERPASVVKELLENALDAGAQHVTAELSAGGAELIRVTDDGCGMSREDAQTAFLRHATSKLRRAEDLEAIHTFGFRGEALAAIASVSRIELVTKERGALSGTFLRFEAGVPSEADEVGCPDGTSVVVRDLFYNTPARMKFLKKDATETSAALSAAESLAIANPSVAFTFLRDGRTAFRTGGTGDMGAVLYEIYGKELFEALLPVQAEHEGFRVEGFVTRPEFARASRNLQLFFLNGRSIRSKTAAAALSEGFRSYMERDRYPAAFLHIHVDPARVDVNVHPAKLEVKFDNERPFYSAVYFAVKNALLTPADGVQYRTQPSAVPEEPKTRQDDAAEKAAQADSTPKAPAAEAVRADEYSAKGSESGEMFAGSTAPLRQTVFPSAALDAPDAPLADGSIDAVFGELLRKRAPNEPLKTDAAEEPEAVSVGAVPSAAGALRADHAARVDTYIPFTVSEAPAEGLAASTGLSGFSAITDKPPTPAEAAVRIPAEPVPAPQEPPRFRVAGELWDTYIVVELSDEVVFIDKHAAQERLIYESIRDSRGSGEVQTLLEPVVCTLSREEEAAVGENLEFLRELGFELDAFGSGAVIVRGVPMAAAADPKTLLETAAGTLAEGKRDVGGELYDRVIYSIACKSSIKAGWKSDRRELESLTAQMLSLPEIRYCPHGRPVAVFCPRSRFSKQFSR